VAERKELMVKDSVEWGWSVEGGELCSGPFISREEALEDASASLDLPTSIELGTCSYARAAQFIRDDLGDLLEQLDMDAYDNGFGFWDNEIFHVDLKEEAQIELTKLLTDWAKKYVYSRVWVLENVEKVLISVTTEGVEHGVDAG
jgi:hypothetical protein